MTMTVPDLQHTPFLASPQAALPDTREGPAMKLLTVKEVAERLACHPETVRRAIKAGEIGYVRRPGFIRIAENDFMDFLERNRCPAQDNRRGSSACAESPTGTSETAATSYRRELKMRRKLNAN
jgi:excisionase family DNA binding protein